MQKIRGPHINSLAKWKKEQVLLSERAHANKICSHSSQHAREGQNTNNEVAPGVHPHSTRAYMIQILKKIYLRQ